jgi:hypothetical protein
MNNNNIPEERDPYVGKMYECENVVVANNFELIIITSRDDSRKYKYGRNGETIYELYLVTKQDYTYCFKHTLEEWLSCKNLREVL